MRRYIPLLLAGLCMLFVISATLLYTMRSAGQRDTGRLSPVVKTLTVYTTIPSEMASIIANEYWQENRIQINFVPINLDEMQQRINTGDFGNADLVLTDSQLLVQMAQAGRLSGSISEQQDIVRDEFKDSSGKWIGVWYDPYVFCYNIDFVKNSWQIPLGWQDLKDSRDIKVAMTDFVAASAAANLLYSMAQDFGTDEALETMRDIHPKVVRYAKYLSTPLRMAGMGEADMAVGVQSEALKYIHDNYPLTIIYPKDGTAYQLTAAGILSASYQKEDAAAFVQWLLGDEVQLALRNSRYYYVPTNYSSLAYKELACSNVRFFGKNIILDEGSRKKLLDDWVKQVRLTD